jgi:hypothetical protein
MMIFVTIETVYSLIRNKKSIGKLRVYLKGILLSLAHVNPIYIVSVCFIVDIMLAIIEFKAILKQNQFTKLLIINHILINLSVLILIFMPQKLTSLFAAMFFMFVFFVVEVYIHLKEYLALKEVSKLN